ncbi:CoA transferase [Novosphingobium sp. MMS21-SN21R]|uniref:CoA transferase n=1 Tax=Novosphingobium sp. MMS21-SN21R TaxID=2969298 RepID=UPI002886FA85|nr:CoA transferase [Novosphingobium sp. MMS21-SN21R]MDT0506439.1 CoA transferase [Novosphingobium sp. MMS21-SN21R]
MYDLLGTLSLIEVSSFVAAPTIGLYCAQFGADVIRVDQIGGGQDFHRLPVNERGDSFSWENLNRAKRSVALDLTRSEGRELLVRLCQDVGTLATNLPPRGFLAHEKLEAGRLDMISVRVMGWPDGAIALDYTVNAGVGYPALTGHGDEPVNHSLPAWDFITGAYGAFALLAAVQRRAATGLGGEVRLPLTDIAMGTVANLGRVAEVVHTGQDRPRLGNAVYGTIGRDFVTADGARVMIVAINERQWQGLVRALDLSSAVAGLEAAFGVSLSGDDGVRFRHRDAIFAVLEKAIAAITHAELVERLDVEGVTHGPYNTLPQAMQDERLFTANPLFTMSNNNPSGLAYPAAGAIATIPQMERTPAVPAPHIGQHTEQVLAERLKLPAGEIARLVDTGIAGIAP